MLTLLKIIIIGAVISCCLVFFDNIIPVVMGVTVPFVILILVIFIGMVIAQGLMLAGCATAILLFFVALLFFICFPEMAHHVHFFFFLRCVVAQNINGKNCEWQICLWSQDGKLLR